MPTKRLYYSDAYKTDFDATIVRMTQHDDRPALVLDRSCFYPTSGGQPHDLGKLGGASVIDVIVEQDDGDGSGSGGEVVHVLERLPAEAATGRTVHGVIDWPRRYDHMQQHSGQHLLSQVFVASLGLETVSVHFGSAVSTVELAVETLDDADLQAVEVAANARVFDNLPIRAYFVDETGLAKLPLRKPPAVQGKIRIVEIEAFDYSACGGTHVRRTGEIGPIKLVGQEKIRGHARIAFLCGRRALDDYARKSRIVGEVAARFSTDPEETPQLVARLQAENKRLQRELATATARLLAYDAAGLAAAAPMVGDIRLVATTLTACPPADLKILAQHLQAEPRTIALLAGVHDDKLTAIFTRSADVNLHAGNLLRRALQQFGGGGGGRPDFAQGGGVPVAEAAALIDFARQQVEEELTHS